MFARRSSIIWWPKAWRPAPGRDCRALARPVHLVARGASVWAVSGRSLSLSLDEARGIAETLSPVLAPEGAGLAVTHPYRWHFRHARPLIFRFRMPPEPEGMVGLPDGPDAIEVQRIQTLIQMALHDAPLNRLREEAGRLPINGLLIEPGGGWLQMLGWFRQ